MPRGRLARPHSTRQMREWTDLEVQALWYAINHEHLMRPSHHAALKRVNEKIHNENRVRQTK